MTMPTERTALLANSQHDSADARVDDKRLIAEEDGNQSPKATPLPTLQMICILGMRATCPFVFYGLFAYVNDELLHYGIADARNVGRYSAMLEACFWLAQLSTVFGYGWISDRIGRRPVLLCPVYFAAVCLVGFGMSKSWHSLFVWRVLTGLGNGVEAVVKTVLVESTDETNQVQAFVYSSMAWQSAATVAPIMSGWLARPARFELLDTPFFRQYPFSLPAFVAAGMTALMGIFAHAYLTETRPANLEKGDQFKPSLSSVISGRLVLVMASWTSIMIVKAAAMNTLVLFCFSPRSMNGLDFTPVQIGSVLACEALLIVTVEPWVGPPLARRYGKLGLLHRVLPADCMLFIGMPLVGMATATFGVPATVVGIAMLLACRQMGHLVFMTADIITLNACPDHRLLGQVNSIQQLCSGIGMLSGTYFSGHLFSSFAGGWPVYACLICGSLVCQVLCSQLTEGGGWREKDAH